jgi:hypothetical protein
MRTFLGKFPTTTRKNTHQIPVRTRSDISASVICDSQPKHPAGDEGTIIARNGGRRHDNVTELLIPERHREET